MNDIELQELWQKHSKDLEENLNINRELLITAKLDKAERSISGVKRYELINLISCPLFFIIAAVITVDMADDTTVLIFGSMGAVLIIIAALLNYVKYRAITEIEFSIGSVEALPSEIAKMQKRLYQFKVADLLLAPILFVSMLVLFAKRFGKYEYIMNSNNFPMIIILGLVILLVTILFQYNVIYRKQLALANRVIEDIESES